MTNSLQDHRSIGRIWEDNFTSISHKYGHNSFINMNDTPSQKQLKQFYRQDPNVTSYINKYGRWHQKIPDLFDRITNECVEVKHKFKPYPSVDLLNSTKDDKTQAVSSDSYFSLETYRYRQFLEWIEISKTKAYFVWHTGEGVWNTGSGVVRSNSTNQLNEWYIVNFAKLKELRHDPQTVDFKYDSYCGGEIIPNVPQIAWPFSIMTTLEKHFQLLFCPV